ncbi:MAG: YebC/PmpR family DNA-binding transcriptional regulator [bacterium]
MSGHSKWKTIKHKKEATDKKRSQQFSKLLAAIRAAAKEESNPQFNVRLRTAIEKAREMSVPQDNIDRALKQAENKNFEDMTIEAYGPGGSALIIIAATDNSNRTIAEIRKIVSDKNGKIAEPGSVLWAFHQPQNPAEEWQAKFPQKVDIELQKTVQIFIDELLEHDDVSMVYTNIAL